MSRGVLVATLLALAPVAAQAESFKIIVNAANTGNSIKRSDATDLFLKKATRWGNGVAAVPVDQSATSPLRARFSDAVLGLTVVAVQQHWQRQIAAGRGAPPMVKTSDEQVIAFVKENAGGIGYVSETAVLPEGVKELKVVE
jgi:ABC-type phosphate transport system substrate-binding protein